MNTLLSLAVLASMLTGLVKDVRQTYNPNSQRVFAAVTVVTHDRQGSARRLEIKASRKLPNSKIDWLFSVEVRRQLGGRHPFASEVVIESCGRRFARPDALMAYSALDIETIGISAEIMPDEIAAMLQCHSTIWLTLSGIEVALDAPNTAKLRAVNLRIRSNFQR